MFDKHCFKAMHMHHFNHMMHHNNHMMHHNKHLNSCDKMCIAGLIGSSFIKGLCIGIYLSEK